MQRDSSRSSVSPSRCPSGQAAPPFLQGPLATWFHPQNNLTALKAELAPSPGVKSPSSEFKIPPYNFSKKLQPGKPHPINNLV